jgi:hypothetical protein
MADAALHGLSVPADKDEQDNVVRSVAGEGGADRQEGNKEGGVETAATQAEVAGGESGWVAIFCKDCAEEGKEVEAEIRCLTCSGEPAFCTKCCTKAHKRQVDHKFGPVRKLPEMCEDIVLPEDGRGGCEKKAYLYCKICDQLLCKDCFIVIHSRGTRVEHSTAPPGQAEDLRRTQESGAVIEEGLDSFRLLPAERAGLPDWLRAAANLNARKLKVKPNAILSVRERGNAQKKKAFFALFKGSNISQNVLNELAHVCEEDEIWEWQQDNVKEAVVDRCEEVKVLGDVAEQLTKEYKGGSQSASNETLKLRIQNLEAGTAEYQRSGKTLDNRGRVLERLGKTCESLKADLQRIHVSPKQRSFVFRLGRSADSQQHDERPLFRG